MCETKVKHKTFKINKKKPKKKTDKLVNSLLRNVAPENHSSPKNKIQGSGGFSVIHYSSHFVMIERNLSNIMLPSKKQRSMTFDSFTPGEIPGIS